MQRQLTGDRPDAPWVADFNYLHGWEGLVVLAFVIDVYHRHNTSRHRSA